MSSLLPFFLHKEKSELGNALLMHVKMHFLLDLIGIEFLFLWS